MGLLDFAILSLSSIFVIVDPIALVPSFLAMTDRDTIDERVRISGLASLIPLVVLLVFSLSGTWIFRIFGITMSAFEIAGGIILLLISLEMLQARRSATKETPEERAAGMSKDDIAITPLAIPMLAGPGAITAVILLSSRAATFSHLVVLVLCIAFVSFATFMILRLASVRSALFSVIALRIISRLMGLLLSAIAVQFILNGILSAGLF